MKLIETIPRVGSYPELQTYRCEKCHNVATLEVKLTFKEQANVNANRNS